MSSRIPYFSLGMGGALVVGVCIYYDWKRRSDPDYKKKVHERRNRAQAGRADNNRSGRQSKAASDRAAMRTEHEKVQQYFQNQVQQAENLFKQSRIDEGLVHLANAIRVCAEPAALLESVEQSLPAAIFKMLLAKIPELTQLIGRNQNDGLVLATD